MPTPVAATHTEHSDDPWTIDINDHPGRTDSPVYVKSRALMVAICREVGTPFWGPGPWQDHHSGVLWVFDTGIIKTVGPDGMLRGTWRTFRNNAGVEWAMQFCADPARIELLRLNAMALYSAFPATLDKFDEMGHPEQKLILATEIKTAEDVAAWVDSIFNASQPLPQPVHTGRVKPGADGTQPIAGIHYYPLPSVWDGQFIKVADFNLIVTDAEGNPAAVVPVAPAGSGDGRVQVIHAQAGSALESDMLAAHAANAPHIVAEDHDLAQQAFARQA